MASLDPSVVCVVSPAGTVTFRFIVDDSVPLIFVVDVLFFTSALRYTVLETLLATGFFHVRYGAGTALIYSHAATANPKTSLTPNPSPISPRRQRIPSAPYTRTAYPSNTEEEEEKDTLACYTIACTKKDKHFHHNSVVL